MTYSGGNSEDRNAERNTSGEDGVQGSQSWTRILGGIRLETTQVMFCQKVWVCLCLEVSENELKSTGRSCSDNICRQNKIRVIAQSLLTVLSAVYIENSTQENMKRSAKLQGKDNKHSSNCFQGGQDGFRNRESNCERDLLN